MAELSLVGTDISLKTYCVNSVYLGNRTNRSGVSDLNNNTLEHMSHLACCHIPLSSLGLCDTLLMPRFSNVVLQPGFMKVNLTGIKNNSANAFLFGAINQKMLKIGEGNLWRRTLED